MADRSTTVRPNGHRARPVMRKTATPSGTPMRVMQSKTPITTWSRASHHPINTTQTRFPTPYRTGDDPGVGTTARPTGQRAKPASLKAWIPKGIPMMVIIKASPDRA